MDNIEQPLKPTREWIQSNDKIVKIDGQGKKILEIIESYINLIKNGYDLSLEETTNYVSSSYRYVLHEIKPFVSQINITSLIRSSIHQAAVHGKIELEDEIGELLKKRILLLRTDFHQFLLDNLIKENKYNHISFEAFQMHESFNKFAKIQEDRSSQLNSLRNASLMLFKEEYAVEVSSEQTSDIPDQLYSLQDLKKHFGFKHNSEMYSWIKFNGVEKYRLGHMVRYDLRDFKKNESMIPIPSGVHVDPIEIILDKAILVELPRRALRKR